MLSDVDPGCGFVGSVAPGTPGWAAGTSGQRLRTKSQQVAQRIERAFILTPGQRAVHEQLDLFLQLETDDAPQLLQRSQRTGVSSGKMAS